mgnify:FL=1
MSIALPIQHNMQRANAKLAFPEQIILIHKYIPTTILKTLSMRKKESLIHTGVERETLQG